MEPTQKDLELLARGAGEIQRAGYGKSNHTEYKDGIEIVTEIDKKAEDYLIEQINARFPGHGIYAEENGITTGDGEHIWYIDPVDGTINFSRGLPHFAVSIGYVYRGEVKYGVVYNPILDEMFAAEKGRGAWLNGQKIQVGTAEQLRRSLVTTGFPYDRYTNPRNNINYFSKMLLEVEGLRRYGSAALDMCYVACGRFDGYWEITLGAYDIAAGILIAREAGAKVTKLDGSEETLEPPFSIVTANPAIHAQMMAVMRAVEGERV